MAFKKSVVFLKIGALVALALIITVSSESCSSTSDCQCKFSNGSVINLKPIASENGFPRFSFLTFPNTSQELSHASFFYDPCNPFDLTLNSFSESHSSCNSVLGCIAYSSSDSQNVTLMPLAGSSSKVTFTPESITYTDGTNSLIVNLSCNKSIDNPIAVVNEDSIPSKFQLTLISKCACLDLCSNSHDKHSEGKGLSTGSILLIVTFTLFMAYIIGGILWNGICQGATGIEMLPNISFWKEFPVLVVEGANYSVSCCRNRSSYGSV